MTVKVKQNLFFLFFSLLFFSTSAPFGYASVGIDPSWTESLAMAINQNFVFGKDFIFNYGPLGYLNTTLLPENVSPIVVVFFHLLLLFNYLFIIKLCFDKLEQEWWIAAIVSVIIFLPWGFFSDVTFTLFYLLLFWLLYVYKTSNTLGLLLGIILAVLIFYIKVNLSLIAYTVFMGSLLYFSVVKIISWRTTAIIIALLAGLTLALSFFLNVSIPHYLEASLKIIDAYQDGQAITILRNKEFLLLLGFEAVIVLLVLLHLFKNIVWFKENIYLYLLVAMAWFLCFKQAHTAVAHYNVFGFFLFLPVLAVLIFLFAEKFQGSGKLIIGVLVLQLIATQFIRLSYTQYKPKDFLLFYFPAEVAQQVKETHNPLKVFNTIVVKNPFNYFIKVFTYSYHHNYQQEEINKVRILPERVLNKIGGKSVDIVPWEISYVFLNKLKYNPRPIIQTYQANSEWLAKKNESKYTSSSAPDFVLANVHDYREQHPSWMDKGVYLSLRENYSLTDTVNMPEETYFLFQKKRFVGPLLYEKTDARKGIIDMGIEVPVTSEPLYLHADVSYNFFGKISRLFFQPPYLRCLVSYEDGQEESFRIPPPILKGGILVNERVVSNDEFNRFAQKIVGNKRVKSIKLWSKSAWGFNKTYSYHFEKIAK